MEPIIKIDLDKVLNSTKPVIIDLGCGTDKEEGRIGIDKVDLPHIDIVADIEHGLPFIPDNSIDEIHCKSVFEHIENFEGLIREIVRILKKNGKAHVFVPHFSNPHYYSDFTHTRFFGLYTFYYFVDKKYQLRRKVPDFYTDTRIKILSQRLIFRSKYKIFSSSFKIERPIKMLLEWFFNLHPSIQEYYEASLCYIFPCKGIEIVFTTES
jgi:ubiquinone/menaquinone biosynthesis C-methylase UbiE